MAREGTRASRLVAEFETPSNKQEGFGVLRGKPVWNRCLKRREKFHWPHLPRLLVDEGVTKRFQRPVGSKSYCDCVVSSSFTSLEGIPAGFLQRMKVWCNGQKWLFLHLLSPTSVIPRIQCDTPPSRMGTEPGMTLLCTFTSMLLPDPHCF